MPPPPPQAFASKQAAIDGAKAFAKQNSYVLVVGHSYKDKVSSWLSYSHLGLRRRDLFVFFLYLGISLFPPLNPFSEFAIYCADVR